MELDKACAVEIIYLIGNLVNCFISCFEELKEFLLVVGFFVTGIGIVQIPFEGCLVHFNISLILNCIHKCFVKYTKQLSSQNCSIEKSDADFSECNTGPCFPKGES